MRHSTHYTVRVYVKPTKIYHNNSDDICLSLYATAFHNVCASWLVNGWMNVRSLIWLLTKVISPRPRARVLNPLKLGVFLETRSFSWNSSEQKNQFHKLLWGPAWGFCRNLKFVKSVRIPPQDSVGLIGLDSFS